MARIQDTEQYPYDISISGSEYVIGTDSDSDNKTKNYKLSDLAAYFTKYFYAQNQSVSLIGNITGGSGVAIIETIANPSIINDKPVATALSDGDNFLVSQGGILKKVDIEVVAASSSYTPPSYTPITLTGDGITFIQSLNRDNLGNIQGASVGTIQDATTTQEGIIRIATPSEYNTSVTNIALPPAAMSSFLPTSAISGGIPFLPKFVGANSVGNSVVQEVSSNIGIGVTPTEKLTVNGNVLASGFKSSSNSENKVFSTDGGEVSGEGDIIIEDTFISVSPFNVTIGDGNYTIPEVKNKLVYVSYEGLNTSGTDAITLPVGVRGQRIYIMRTNDLGTGTVQILSSSVTLELELKRAYILYNNGHTWVYFSPIVIGTM